MPDEPTDIVRLATAKNPAMANIWEQALEAEGIRCMVVGDYLDASFGDIPGLQPELWVFRRDLHRGQAIINEKNADVEEVVAPVAMEELEIEEWAPPDRTPRGNPRSAMRFGPGGAVAT
jgi:hypothetical protein